MSRLAWLAVVFVFVTPLSLTGQDAKPKPDVPPAEPFTCETYDGVNIVGDYFPPGRGRGQRGPCVILLHPIGAGRGTASRRDFGPLPARLQQEGLAVVTFDFRGYGDSQAIDASKFLLEVSNQARVSKDKPTKLDCRDFRAARDFTPLANDLVAVKVWLNGKNNDKSCNSHNVAVLAVEQAGVVGLAWLANELQDPNRPLNRDNVKNNRPDRFEGEDVASFIWLGGCDRLAGERVDNGQLQKWINLARDRKIQTLAVVPESDGNAKAFWDKAEKWIKPAKEKEGYKQTRVHRIKGTTLGGLKLLEHDAFELQPELVKFLNETLESNGRDWEEHKGNKQVTPINFRSLGL